MGESRPQLLPDSVRIAQLSSDPHLLPCEAPPHHVAPVPLGYSLLLGGGSWVGEGDVLF